MAKIIDYRIIASLEGNHGLITEVVEAIAEGWEPIGGISFTTIPPIREGDKGTLVWAQAVVKYDL